MGFLQDGTLSFAGKVHGDLDDRLFFAPSLQDRMRTSWAGEAAPASCLWLSLLCHLQNLYSPLQTAERAPSAYKLDLDALRSVLPFISQSPPGWIDMLQMCELLQPLSITEHSKHLMSGFFE